MIIKSVLPFPLAIRLLCVGVVRCGVRVLFFGLVFLVFRFVRRDRGVGIGR